jgi:iron complex outermembrane receptor protein
LYDLERVEVAKGPQGTLYGRNANGGAINIITHQAKLNDDSAFAELEVGNFSLVRVTSAANFSPTDTFALRLAGQSYSHDGYYKSGLGDADEKSGRLSTLWAPTENDTLKIVADYEKIGGRGAGSNVVAKQPGDPHPYPISSNPWDDTYYVTDVPGERAEIPDIDQTNRGITATYDRVLPFATWTTEAAWRKFESTAYSVSNFGSVDATNPASAEYLRGTRNLQMQRFTSDSVESRLASSDSTPVQWVGGLYFFHDDDGGTNRSYTSMRSIVPSTEIANGHEIAKSYAAFGQATWTPDSLESLHFTAGGRYTRDEKQASGIFTRFGTATTAPGYTLVPTASDAWSAFTYKGGISYDITDSNLVYASYATGYKAGGFGYGPGVSAAGPEYKPEKIKAYEVGNKNRFLNDRLQVNLEAYYYKYRDFQSNLTLFSPASPLPILTVASAGAATYKGGAVDVKWVLTQNDDVAFEYALNRGEFNQYILTAPAGYSLNSPGGASFADLSNTDIPGIPRYSGTASYTHLFRLPKGGLDAQIASNYRGPLLLGQNGSLTLDPVYGVLSPTALNPTRRLVYQRTGGFVNLDFSMRYTTENDGMSVTAYVHNVADRFEVSQGSYSGSTHLFTQSYYAPRTYGLIFSVKVK